MKKTTRILSFVASMAVAVWVAVAQPVAAAATAPALSPAGEPQAKQPNWKSNEEYQAFTAMANEKDPNKQIAAAQAFLEKFKDSDFKYAACLAMMQAYQALGKSDQAIASARKALEFSPDNPEALTYLCFSFPYVFNSKNPTADADLSTAENDAKHGLDVLQKLVKPEKATPEQFDAYVKPKRAIFNTAIGFVAVQRKDYASAITALKAAADDNPNDNLIFSLMGQAYLFSKPPDYDNAIWYLARSVALAQAAHSPNAAALEKFYGQVYVSRHGSNDGQSGVLTQAATSVNPPADFKVAPAPKHAATGNQLVDTFYSWADALKSGGDTEKQQWDSLKGQPFGGPGVVDSIEKGTEANTYLVRIDITDESKAKEGTWDIELKDTTQADAKYLSKGDPVRFQGTISAYVTAPSFVLTLDPGTINQEDLDSAKAKAQEKAPKKTTRPARKRTTH
jgi:tetratricopeptide (TPR) repeat protein